MQPAASYANLRIEGTPYFLKTVVFSPDGYVLARASVGYPTLSPEPGWSEQDPEEWWAVFLNPSD
jgi:glycerol kinase